MLHRKTWPQSCQWWGPQATRACCGIKVLNDLDDSPLGIGDAVGALPECDEVLLVRHHRLVGSDSTSGLLTICPPFAQALQKLRESNPFPLEITGSA